MAKTKIGNFNSDKFILSERDKRWIQALQDAALELNMDVDWERMRLVELRVPPYPRDTGDFDTRFDVDQE